MLPLQRSGNRKTRTDKRLGTTLTYAYDNMYQLLTAKQGTTTKESYTGACPERYSSREAMRVSRRNPVGNRLSSVGVSPYSYNSSNQLTSIPGTTYTYDNNGNTKTKTTAAGTTTYTWDYDNRLTQVALPGTAGTVTFKYDPFGRRVQKAFTQGGNTTTTNYLYDGPNLIEEMDNAGNVLARYANQMRVDEPLTELRSGTTSYYQQDGLGSVTSLSNGAGMLANTYTFDSYGKLNTSTGRSPIPSSTRAGNLTRRPGSTTTAPDTMTQPSVGLPAKIRLAFKGGRISMITLATTPSISMIPVVSLQRGDHPIVGVIARGPRFRNAQGCAKPEARSLNPVECLRPTESFSLSTGRNGPMDH